MGRALIVASILGATLPAAATVVRPLMVSGLLAESTLVVEGRVGAASTSRDPESGYPMTDTTVEVTRVLFGPRLERVVVRQRGGELDGLTTRVVGDGTLREGDRVALFLRAGRDGSYYLTALAQGVFVVEGEGDGARLSRDLSGLSMWHPGEKDDPVRAAPRTLGELRDAVRAAVRDRR